MDQKVEVPCTRTINADLKSPELPSTTATRVSFQGAGKLSVDSFPPVLAKFEPDVTVLDNTKASLESDSTCQKAFIKPLSYIDPDPATFNSFQYLEDFFRWSQRIAKIHDVILELLKNGLITIHEVYRNNAGLLTKLANELPELKNKVAMKEQQEKTLQEGLEQAEKNPSDLIFGLSWKRQELEVCRKELWATRCALDHKLLELNHFQSKFEASLKPWVDRAISRTVKAGKKNTTEIDDKREYTLFLQTSCFC